MNDTVISEEEQAKRELVITTSGNDVNVVLTKRRIGDRDNPVLIDNITLKYAGLAGSLGAIEYVIKSSAQHTWVRLQDDARKTMQTSEIEALDGTTVDVQEFWDARQTRKPRAVKPITVERAQEAIKNFNAADVAKLFANALKDNPELAALLNPHPFNK